MNLYTKLVQTLMSPQRQKQSSGNITIHKLNREEMRLFDPWPVFFKREWKRCWPFLTGFAVTGALITKLTAGLTEEDAKNSKFVQQHRR